MNGRGEVKVCLAVREQPQHFLPLVRALVDNLAPGFELLCGRRLERDGSGRRVGPGRLARGGAHLTRRLSGLAVDEWLRVRGLRRFLTRRGVSVVLAESGLAGVQIRCACEKARVPLVVHFHGSGAYDRAAIERWGDGYRRVFSTCAAVVAVSHRMEEQLIRLGAPREKVRYNPYGVDLERFRPTDPAANPPLFVAVGRFVEKKAPHLTLLAFRRVLDACPDARLLMVGDGALFGACSDIVGALEMSDAVELRGCQTHQQVAEALAGGRAFVQHSITAQSGDSEGTPNAILEAGACALPAVSTRHAGIPEAVVEGETGFLVDERDVRGMAECMISLARDPGLAARMGAAARERIGAEFSMERSISGLWSIVVDAAGRR